jgi:diacylglycerol kinase
MSTRSPSTRPRNDAPARPRPRPWRDQVRGVKLGVRGQSSFFVHFFFAALAAVAATALGCTLLEWCVLLGCMGLVLTAELFNSSLELLFRGFSAEARPRVGPCLDVAAGAVLVARLTAGGVGVLLFVAKLLERFQVRG